MRKTKRDLLKGLAIGTAWSTPIVNSVVLPVHADMTIEPTSCDPLSYPELTSTCSLPIQAEIGFAIDDTSSACPQLIVDNPPAFPLPDNYFSINFNGFINDSSLLLGSRLDGETSGLHTFIRRCSPSSVLDNPIDDQFLFRSSGGTVYEAIFEVVVGEDYITLSQIVFSPAEM